MGISIEKSALSGTHIHLENTTQSIINNEAYIL